MGYSLPCSLIEGIMMRRASTQVIRCLIVCVIAMLAGCQTEDRPQAKPVSPQLPVCDVYCCSVETYRPWRNRMRPPADYKPYRFSAHIEIYLPEFGVAYLPASGFFVPADTKRYSEPKVAPSYGGQTFRAVRVSELTLRDETLRDVLRKYNAYQKEKSAPNRSDPVNGT